MKGKLFLLGACILAILALQEASAYSYSYGWQGGGYTYQPSGYKDSPSNYQPVSYGTTFAKWGARNRGGFFPAIYEPQRPYGYQGNTFKSGSSYGRAYKDQQLTWWYGAGRSDWYYDSGFKVQSQYRMYG